MDRVRTSEILEYENIDTNEYHHSDFEINCDENGFKSNSFNFYKTFNNKQEAYDYIENFLRQFKNLRALYSHIFNQFGFINPKGDYRFNAYFMLKDELEDDCNTFEKFNERYNF